MIVAGAIVFIIIAIIAVRMIVTAINSSSQKALAEEGSQGYTMVDSTELGEDGKPLQVPVPDGFTASQVPGETTVNGGFVIYEGEVDWSKIEDLNSYAEVATQAEETNTSSENASSAENVNNVNSENTNSDGTNTEGAGKEKNNTEAENNTDSTGSSVTNNSVDSAENSEIKNTEEEEQTEGEADVSEDAEQGDAQEGNITNEAEGTQKEDASASENGENGINGDVESQVSENEETETTEEEKEEQANNEIIKEEESISNEEAGIATMSEEGKDEETGIATLAEGETPTTVFDLQTSRNQYVWVPVKEVSRIYGVDSNGKLWGKLYNYSSTGRTNNNWSESSGVMSKPGTGYREPDVVRNRTAYDADSKIQGYRDGIEQYQMLSQEMEENFYKMIESVKKYGGFYIGRYETGDLNQEEAVVQKMNTNIASQTWYVMYEKCKNLAGTNENVQTSMIWGSLWDETLQWLVDSEAKISTGETIDYTLISNSTNWGNYRNATFEYTTTSGGTSTKNTGSSTRIPTGSADYTKANNIYDMAGNVYDWTLEASSTDVRVFRGGHYGNGSSYPVRSRNYSSPSSSSYSVGCRASLYIK